MRITRATLYTAFAKLLGDRLESDALLSYADLAWDWSSTGLRTSDLDLLLQELYESESLDRTVISGHSWYRLTEAGTRELLRYHHDLWTRLRNGLTLLQAQWRRRRTSSNRSSYRRRRSDTLRQRAL